MTSKDQYQLEMVTSDDMDLNGNRETSIEIDVPDYKSPAYHKYLQRHDRQMVKYKKRSGLTVTERLSNKTYSYEERNVGTESRPHFSLINREPDKIVVPKPEFVNSSYISFDNLRPNRDINNIDEGVEAENDDALTCEELNDKLVVQNMEFEKGLKKGKLISFDISENLFNDKSDEISNESSDESIMGYSFETSPPGISSKNWNKLKVDLIIDNIVKLNTGLVNTPTLPVDYLELTSVENEWLALEKQKNVDNLRSFEGMQQYPLDPYTLDYNYVPKQRVAQPYDSLVPQNMVETYGQEIGAYNIPIPKRVLGISQQETEAYKIPNAQSVLGTHRVESYASNFPVEHHVVDIYGQEIGPYKNPVLWNLPDYHRQDMNAFSYPVGSHVVDMYGESTGPHNILTPQDSVDFYGQKNKSWINFIPQRVVSAFRQDQQVSQGLLPPLPYKYTDPECGIGSEWDIPLEVVVHKPDIDYYPFGGTYENSPKYEYKKEAKKLYKSVANVSSSMYGMFRRTIEDAWFINRKDDPKDDRPDQKV